MDVPHMPIATERGSVHLPAFALISTLVLRSVGALYGGIGFLLDPGGVFTSILRGTYSTFAWIAEGSAPASTLAGTLSGLGRWSSRVAAPPAGRSPCGAIPTRVNCALGGATLTDTSTTSFSGSPCPGVRYLPGSIERVDAGLSALGTSIGNLRPYFPLELS